MNTKSWSTMLKSTMKLLETFLSLILHISSLEMILLRYAFLGYYVNPSLFVVFLRTASVIIKKQIDILWNTLF